MKYTKITSLQFPAISEYQVSNASIGYFGYIFKGLQSLDSIMPSDYSPLKTHSIIRNTINSKTVRVDKPALSVVNSWVENFYHFTWETLVKIYLLREQLPTATLVFPAERKGFHTQWLSMLGITDITWVEKKQRIKTPLAISSSSFELTMPGAKAILEGFREWVISRMNQQGLLEDKSRYPKRIFITRTKVRYRNIVNLAELEPLVTRYGYSIVELEDYSIAQQVNFFYHAEDIVGVHGAGFAYIGFSKAPVLDIIVSDFISLWFEKIAGIMETGYEYLRTPGVPNDFPDKRPGYHDILVDLEKLEEKLKERREGAPL